MRRFLRVLAGVSFILSVVAGPATAGARPAARSACVSSAAATYRHTFTGSAGAATVAAVVPLCAGQSQAFSLVSYTVGAGSPFVYDTDQAVVDSTHRDITLDVAVPRCTTEVEAVFGSDVHAGDTAYGNAELGSASGVGHRSSGTPARYTGGGSACAPKPSVTFTSDCDGGFTATLTNHAGATVTAVFLVDGRTYRVAPGARTTVVGDTGGSLTVRDNTLKTNTGTWSMPAVCTQPTPVSTTNPTPPLTATSTTATASPASPASAGSSVAAPSAVTPPPSGTLAAGGGTTFEPSAEAAAPAAASRADPAVTSSSSGSVALIALGVLLIGGGLVILGRQIHRARQAR